METWMSAAMVVEATMLSFLMALWIAWMSLLGLFRMFPAARLNAIPIRSAAERVTGPWAGMQPRALCALPELFRCGPDRKSESPRRVRSEIRGSGGTRPCSH